MSSDHRYGPWQDLLEMPFLKKRLCDFHNDVEWGIFHNGTFHHKVDQHQVDEYMAAVEQATHTHQVDLTLAETTHQDNLGRIQQRLIRDLLKAKLRLTGGVL